MIQSSFKFGPRGSTKGAMPVEEVVLERMSSEIRRGIIGQLGCLAEDPLYTW
jgi:hypothetical protein